MRETQDRVLVALGGNALIRPGQAGTLDDQRAALRVALDVVVELIVRGHRVVLTHGNGPQVGAALLRAEAARGRAYDLPLDVCVAQSQGELGYLVAETLDALLRRRGVAAPPCVALLTRTLVEDAPEGRKPVKPIGPWYGDAEARERKKEGWVMADDAHRGARRLVPSPKPVAVVEADAVRALVERGVPVVAGGGGGIPLRATADGARDGLAAVVDKDYTSALLARDVGAARWLNVTGVEHVKLDFGTPRERNLPFLSVPEARRFLAEGHFAPGSMGPKIDAAIQFLEAGGREVLIATPDLARAAWDGRAGTRLSADPDRTGAIRG